jgi:hypothetical protein
LTNHGRRPSWYRHRFHPKKRPDSLARKTGPWSLDVCHGCRMAIDIDLNCQLSERRVSRSAQPKPRRSPVLPRPMHDSHCGYPHGERVGVRGRSEVRWGHSFDVQCWTFGDRTELSIHVQSPLTPPLSPRGGPPQEHLGVGRGRALRRTWVRGAHGVHSTSRSARFADGFVSARDPVHRSKCPNSKGRFPWKGRPARSDAGAVGTACGLED